MHPSRYNLFFKARDGRYLLFNTLSRFRFFVDQELKEVIETGALEGVDPGIVEQLGSYGIFTDKDELEYFTNLYRQRVTAPFEYELTLLCSYECNLKCYYCTRSEETLSHEVFSGITEFFTSQLEGDFENVALRIGGGEPLVHLDMVVSILETLRQATEEHGKKFFSAIATNGTLVTQDVVDQLTPFLNAVQITFEGNREYHDTVRNDGRGTFDRVLNSVERFRDSGVVVNMRVHVSEKNGEGLEELFDTLKSVGVGMQSRTMITPAPVIKTRICPLYPAQCTEPEALRVISTAWESAKNCGLLLCGMPSLSYEMLPCPYVTPTSLIVDPRGMFYTCLRNANEQKGSVGDIKKGVTENVDVDTLNRSWPHVCESCHFLPFCGGGCIERSVSEPSSCPSRLFLDKRLQSFLKNEHPILE
jgi:uncharacterized protein